MHSAVNLQYPPERLAKIAALVIITILSERVMSFAVCTYVDTKLIYDMAQNKTKNAAQNIITVGLFFNIWNEDNSQHWSANVENVRLRQPSCLSDSFFFHSASVYGQFMNSLSNSRMFFLSILILSLICFYLDIREEYNDHPKLAAFDWHWISYCRMPSVSFWNNELDD